MKYSLMDHFQLKLIFFLKFELINQMNIEKSEQNQEERSEINFQLHLKVENKKNKCEVQINQF